MSNGLRSDAYVIRNVAYESNHLNTLHGSGDRPRKLALVPGTGEKIEVKNIGNNHYVITATGTDTAPIDGQVYGIFHSPPSTEHWTLKYYAEYDAYTVNATSQDGAWYVSNGDAYTQVALGPTPSAPSTNYLFTFTGPGPHAHDE